MALRAASAPLLPAFDPGALHGLLQRVRSYHAEGRRHAGSQPDLGDALGGFTGHEFEMWRLSANHASQTDNRVELLALREFLGHERQLERTGYEHRGYVILRTAVPFQRVDRSGQKLAGNELIKPAYHDRKLLFVDRKLSV